MWEANLKLNEPFLTHDHHLQQWNRWLFILKCRVEPYGIIHGSASTDFVFYINSLQFEISTF